MCIIKKISKVLCSNRIIEMDFVFFLWWCVSLLSKCGITKTLLVHHAKNINHTKNTALKK